MSSRARLIALAVVAVLLPTTIMSGLQYRSLRDLQEQTRMAAQENLRQAAAGLSGKTAGYFHRLGLQTFADFRYEKSAGSAQDETIGRLFRTALQSAPAIESVFMVSDCSCSASAGTALIQDRAGLRRVAGKALASEHEVKHLAHLHERAMMLASQRPPSESRYLFTYVPACPQAGFQVYLFYPLLDSAGKEIGFTGMRLDGKQIAGGILPAILNESIASNLAFAIHDETGRLVYGNNEHQQIAPDNERDSHALKTAFAPVFPQWTLALDYRAASVEELARGSFRQNMVLSSFVLALLVVGIVLTLRATSREMKLAEAKSSFVSNVSHELKTPLALIRLFAETLELGRIKSPEKAQEYYRIINNESSRLTQLINNILDFSKIEAGRKEYEFENSDAGRIVEEVIRSYECPIRNEGFDLRTRIEPDLPAVKADRGAISQAVLNLLNNAVKYSESVKRIEVSVYRVNGSIAIEVADEGIGIPASEQQRIFEKFYRISNGLVHDRKGTGLGLTLVRHIVNAHQGTVHVSSAPGKGSRFTIHLPAVQERSTPARLLAYEGSDYRG